MVVFTLAMMVLSMALGSMMIGGEVHSMIRVRSGLKHEFGEVFRFGWGNKWDLMKINVINSLIIMLIIVPLITLLSLVGIVLSVILPIIGICLFFLVYMAMIPLFSSLVAVAYLPFIIWIYEGKDPWSSIKKAWKIYFEHLWSFVGFGLVVGLINMAGSMVPGVNILAMMIIGPSIILALVFIYEELVPPVSPRSKKLPYPKLKQGFVKYK
jgi:hypothetical protein